MKWSLVKFFVLTKALFSDFIFFMDCPETCGKNSTAVNKTQNLNYTMVTNGCGSYGVSINFEKNLTEFNSCCNIHDICYQTCSKTKEICDNTFKNCLTDVCGRYNRTNQLKAKSCTNVLASLMHKMTDSFGCLAYTHAQYAACLCGS